MVTYMHVVITDSAKLGVDLSWNNKGKSYCACVYLDLIGGL